MTALVPSTQQSGGSSTKLTLTDGKSGGVIEVSAPLSVLKSETGKLISVEYRPSEDEIDKGARPTSLCFTDWKCAPQMILNPNGPGKEVWAREPTFNAEKMRYLVFQVETTKEGRYHWQGYVEFFNKTSYISAAKHLGIYGDHVFRLLKRAGTAKQASVYCTPYATKDGKPKEGVVLGTCKEFGVLSAQGDRKDLKEIVNMAKSGASKLDIIEDVGIDRFARIRNTVADVSVATAKLMAIKKPPIFLEWTVSSADEQALIKSNHVLSGSIYYKAGKVDHKTNFDGYSGERIMVIYEVDHEWKQWVKSGKPMWLNMKYGGTWLTSDVHLFVRPVTIVVE